jgi:hypothetical protein
MRTVTVVESPVALPAAPLSVGVLLLVTASAAGVVRVTAGAKSAAVVNDEPPFCALPVNVAREPCTAAVAARTAASRPRTWITPLAPPAPPWSCRATARPGC